MREWVFENDAALRFIAGFALRLDKDPGVARKKALCIELDHQPGTTSPVRFDVDQRGGSRLIAFNSAVSDVRRGHFEKFEAEPELPGWINVFLIVFIRFGNGALFSHCRRR